MANYLVVHRLMRQLQSGQLNRRDFIKRTTALGFSVPAIASFLAACGSDDDDDPTATAPPAAEPTATDAPEEADDEEEDEADPTAATDEPSPTEDTGDADEGEGARFEKLVVALNTDLASLDLMWGSPNINRDVMGHVYEYLFTMGEGNVYVPDLADSMDISSDGRTFTINLRQGVLFHNGKEMTSEDVLASIQRWERMTSRGTAVMGLAESVEATDDYTLTVTFAEPAGGFLYSIGHYGGLFGIFPSEVVEKYYDESAETPDSQIIDIEDAIGTGPYQIREWVPDRSVIMDRFEDYVGHTDPVNGRGGTRHAYADVIEFIPVPDPTTRLNGLIAGEYHLAYALESAQYEQILGDDSLVPYVIKPGSKAVGVFNKQKGPFTDQKLRQAALAATDPFEVMAGTIDNEEFYGAFASLAGPEWEAWYTEVGKDLYETRDIERAKQLLEESDYDGETLRWITTREFDYMYRSALIASQQWQEAGFNIELVVSDWPTVVTDRSNPDAYEIFSTGIGFAGHSLGTGAYTPTWPGWTTSPGVTGAFDALILETDEAQVKELWEDLQEAFYEEVPYIQFGEMYTLRVARAEVKGFTNRPDFMVWNVWIDEA